MYIWPEEPWQGFEQNEVYTGSFGGVDEDDSHAAAFLTVANNSSLCVEDRFLQWNFSLHGLFWD
jgi:hypothetical protein